MRRFNLLILLFFAGSYLISCTNLGDAKADSRNSFVYYYGGVGNYQAVAALELSDGYLLVGDSVSAPKYSVVVIRTDKTGKAIWSTTIEHAVAGGAIATPTGYLVVGDSMNVDLTQTVVADQVKRKMRLISINTTGAVVADASWSDPDDPTNDKTAVRGNAVALDGSGNIVTVGTIQPRGATAYVSIASFDPVTLKAKWFKKYDQDARDYQNSISTCINGSGDVIWASSAVVTTQQTARAFVRIPVLDPTSTFVNQALYGQNDTNAPNVYYSGNDIQPSAVGYGIIGTYANYIISGQNDVGDDANFFFMRTDVLGNIIPNSVIFFDGQTLAKTKKPLTDADKTTNLVQDKGITLASTSDGGFLLAGYTTSSSDGSWGNGGKDILLIRIDAAGNFVWYKTFGGSGDEQPGTVRQTADGGFIISATLLLAGQNSMFLLKTDSNGDLKN